MNYLRQSTAASFPFGPFVDSTDGVTPETALTISQADVRLKKNDGAWAQKNESSSAAHEENGWYEIATDTTDTNTVGILMVAVYETGALPVWREFQVLEEAVYDSLFAASAAGPLGEVVEGAVTLRQAARLWNSALGAKASGLATATAVYRDLGDTKDRITATVDADGNRTAVTRDLT